MGFIAQQKRGYSYHPFLREVRIAYRSRGVLALGFRQMNMLDESACAGTAGRYRIAYLLLNSFDHFQKFFVCAGSYRMPMAYFQILRHVNVFGCSLQLSICIQKKKKK